MTEHHQHDLDPLQRDAWLTQISILHQELNASTDGWLAFEFHIPRMGKRVDAVIILGSVIFVIEFKTGSKHFDRSAIEQVVDYALDLKNFHAGSHDRRIIPVLIATEADHVSHALTWGNDNVAKTIKTNKIGLGRLFHTLADSVTNEATIDPTAWIGSGYRPTPTIIEAAQALYKGHSVEEISRSDSGAKNLSLTTIELTQIISAARQHHRKAICFVTGVPGAGKTLAGLNLATRLADASGEERAVFLSGNGPLVDVLREALARDEKMRSNNQITKANAARKVSSFIQNVHHFRDESFRSVKAPTEHIVIFDEAQRAWDSAQLVKFMRQKRGQSQFEMSEPEFLISVMNRHSDWCTIICLVGGGQEINSGEAGLPEWFRALRKSFPDWQVYVSPALSHPEYHWNHDPTNMTQNLNVTTRDELHLSVSVRSFRAEKLSDFVALVISGDATGARAIHAEIENHYPFFLTRSLPQARTWLIKQARGSERFGLVASSGASRLKPEGLNVHEKIDAKCWFLNDRTDVRSSFYLEDPATEFDTQGLELDWVGVCWEGNFRYLNSGWSYHAFRGTKWQNIHDASQQTYLANAYRVLLARARQGLVIYIPQGSDVDPTREPLWYQSTFEFLQRCGIGVLPPDA